MGETLVVGLELGEELLRRCVRVGRDRRPACEQSDARPGNGYAALGGYDPRPELEVETPREVDRDLALFAGQQRGDGNAPPAGVGSARNEEAQSDPVRDLEVDATVRVGARLRTAQAGGERPEAFVPDQRESGRHAFDRQAGAALADAHDEQRARGELAARCGVAASRGGPPRAVGRGPGAIDRRLCVRRGRPPACRGAVRIPRWQTSQKEAEPQHAENCEGESESPAVIH